MGAPLGNSNAANAKIWGAAVRRALQRRSSVERGEAIDALAERLLDLCFDPICGLSALKELGDRLDGRPSQQIIATDEEGRSLAVALISYNPVPVQPEALPAPDIEGTGQRH